MVICDTAPPIKSARKTADIGTSTDTVGIPPKAAFDGGYGGPGIVGGWRETLLEGSDLLTDTVCSKLTLAEGDDIFSKRNLDNIAEALRVTTSSFWIQRPCKLTKV
jgi:hypothetical protein